MEKVEPNILLVGLQNGAATSKTVFAVPQNVSIDLTND